MLRILLKKAMPWPHLRFVVFSYVQTPIKLQFYAAEEVYSCRVQKKKFIWISFKIVLHLMAWPGPVDFRFEQGLIEVCTYEKPACQSFATSRVPATVKSLIGRVFRVCSGFVHMKTQHARDLAANVLFSSVFAVDWCLLLLLAVSHRLFASIWSGRSMCFTGSLPLSNYCVCSLALDFIVTRCVSPCPWNFNVGRCINKRSSRLSADQRVRFFTFVSSTLAWGGRG